VNSRTFLAEFAGKFSSKPLAACLDSVKVPAKIPRSSFLSDGKLPVISQESDFINGYWDNDEDAVRVDCPVVIFGDHTQVLKLIDFDFVVGADGVKILKPKEFLDAAYLRYFLEANPIPSLGYARHWRHISDIDVPLPPLDEQKRIVAVLDQAFAAIDRARADAEANLADAQVLFTAFVTSKFSKRNEWPNEELGCRVHFVDYRGKTPPKSESGIRLITAKNVRMGFVKEDPREFVPESAYKEWMTRGIPKVGDVLFTTEAPLANVAQLETDERVVIGQRLITMQTKHDEIDSGFLKWSLISSQMQSDIHSRGTGATVLGIKASLLKKILLYVPKSIELQKRIASDCEAAFATKTQLEKQYSAKLADLARLRQTLLQKAFSGELT
jgi:type I restriction enzyme S subunit